MVSLISVLATASLNGADIAARLLGAVSDASGAAVPGATVQARNVNTGVVFTSRSNEAGNYSFESLPAGTYEIVCQQDGFKQFRSQDVVLESQKSVTLPIALEVGDMTQSVEVSAAALQVDTTTPTIQNTFAENTLLVLPFEGRDPRVAAERLMAGARPGGSESGVERTSFNGVSGAVNNYRVDGTETIDHFHATATPFPGPENMAEFNVQSSLPDATRGRGAGDSITAVLKSGTNGLHGAGWTYLRNNRWNANRWENNRNKVYRPRTPGNQQWYGGNVGGPVMIPNLYDGRNRTFFFTSYERTNLASTGTRAQRVLTEEERRGDFRNSREGIPVIDGVPTPVLNPADFSPLAKALLANDRLLPNATTPEGDFLWNPRTTDTTNTFIGKIDHNFSDRHRLFGSLFWYRNRPYYDRFQYAGSGLPLTSGTEFPKYLQSWTLNDTFTVTPSLLNNFILGVKRLDNSVRRVNHDPDLRWDKLGTGIIPNRGSDMAQVQISVQSGPAWSGGYDDNQREQSIYVADNVTAIKGAHTLQFGYEERIHTQNKLQNWDAGGVLTYNRNRQNNGGTGNPIADFLLDRGGQLAMNGPLDLILRYPAREAYFQDRIRFNNKLTATLAVRWSPHFGPRDERGRLTAFVAGRQSKVYPTAPAGLLFPGDDGVPNATYSRKWWNFGPRIGIAYDLLGNGRMAIRAGYGIYYDYQILKDLNSFGERFPFSSRIPTLLPVNVVNPYVGVDPVPPYQPPAPGDTNIKFPTLVQVYAYDPDYNAGRIHQYNLNFEFEPIKAWMFSAAYIGTRGTHLDARRDVNYPRFIPGASTDNQENTRNRRPLNPAYEQININFSDENSRYDSMQLTVNKRMSSGFTLMGNYTLSRSVAQRGARMQWDRSIDYYSPGRDQRFALTYAYELPKLSGANPLVKTVLGGWVLGGTVTMRSGDWLGIGSRCNFNANSAGCTGNYFGGEKYATSKGADFVHPQASTATKYATENWGVQWLNPAVFFPADFGADGKADPKAGVEHLAIGNTLTGIVKGPSGYYHDMTVTKRFMLTETIGLEAMLSAFNALNHPVLGNPNTSTDQAADFPDRFGKINGTAGDPRELQLTFRIRF